MQKTKSINGVVGIRDHFVTYAYWIVDRIDRSDAATGGRGFGMIIPLDKIKVEHFDLQLTRSFFPFADRNPANLRYILMHEPGIFMGPVVKIMISWMPERLRKIIHVTDGNAVYQYAKKRELPSFVGAGRRPEIVPMPYVPEPDVCAELWTVARRLKWPTDTVQYFQKVTAPAVRRHRNGNQT